MSQYKIKYIIIIIILLGLRLRRPRSLACRLIELVRLVRNTCMYGKVFAHYETGWSPIWELMAAIVAFSHSADLSHKKYIIILNIFKYSIIFLNHNKKTTIIIFCIIVYTIFQQFYLKRKKKLCLIFFNRYKQHIWNIVLHL